MKLGTFGIPATAAVLAFGLPAAWADNAELGKPVADFSLTDVMSGKTIKLSDYKGKIVVINFISHKCPVSVAYDTRLAQFTAEYASKNVVFLHIDSNGPNTPEECKKAAEKVNLGAPVLKDYGNKVADYFQARTTPHLYVVDKDGNLAYRGSFDDGKGTSFATVTKHYVKDAVEALLAGKEVPVKETKAFGCTIKRVAASKS